MSSSLPHVIINATDATCTNTIHRLIKKKHVPANRLKSLSLSSITTLSAISSELEGRSLGGGLLKLEPNMAKRIMLAAPKELIPNSIWKDANSLLRDGDIRAAMDIADQAILVEKLGIKKSVLRNFRTSYEKLRNYRLNRRNSKRKLKLT
jgi:hypothetical protein